MTQREQRVLVYSVTCDGTRGDGEFHCEGRLPHPDDDFTDVESLHEVEVLLDVEEWRTVVRYGQAFHYCHVCKQLLCGRCERWVGDWHVPGSVCVFCRMRAGDRPRIRAYFPRLLFLPDSPLTVPTMVEAVSVEIDAARVTVPGSAPALPGGAWAHGVRADEVSLPVEPMTVTFTASPTPETWALVFGEDLPRQEPIRLQPSRTMNWRQVTGWSAAFLAAILIWLVLVQYMFGWPL